MLRYEDFKPESREKIERLMRVRGLSLNEAMEELVIHSIAMGGLTLAGRPKAKVTSILGPPKKCGTK